MLKSIRRFWRNKGWAIAIKNEVVICFGNEVSIMNANEGKMNFSEMCIIPLTHPERFFMDIPNFFGIFDGLWSLVHNVKDFPKYSRFK